jgi:drug/metabolite transporter (DMT)-like permease
MSSDSRGSVSRDAAIEAALLAMCAFWALNVVILKLLLRVLPPPALSGGRYLIVCGVALAVVAAGRGPWTVGRQDLARFVLSGFLGVTVYQILFLEGLHRSTAFASNLLQGMEPLFALGLLSLRGRSRVSPRQWVGVLVALAGAALFFLDPARGRLQLLFGLGDLLNLAGAFVFAVYGLVSAPVFARYPGRTAMAVSMIAGTLPLLLWSGPSLLAVDWRGLGPTVWGALLVSSVLPLYAGFWIWNWAVARKGLDHASLYIFVDIVMSGVFAWALLGERFGPLRLLGAAVILAGILLARSGERSEAGSALAQNVDESV